MANLDRQICDSCGGELSPVDSGAEVAWVCQKCGRIVSDNSEMSLADQQTCVRQPKHDPGIDAAEADSLSKFIIRLLKAHGAGAPKNSV